MKKLFIAGNWKSNKTISESVEWMGKFRTMWENATVVVAAPFLSLPELYEEVKKASSPLLLGAQNVSKYDEGAYTGEVTAKMIKEVADYVIIGHSERRKYFGETDEDLAAKVEKAKSAGLKIIYCVPDDKTSVPAGVDVVAYEPVWAIGTGKTDTPENADAVVASIKKNTGTTTVIYGGSVTADNVASFVHQPAIDGVLPGGASLDPTKFAHLIENALA